MKPMVGGVQEELTIGSEERPISEVVADTTTAPDRTETTPRRRGPRKKSDRGTPLPLWED